MQISIVVACRNEAGQVASFVDSMLNQDFGGAEWQAIIADGLSTDGTREMLEEYARRNSRLQVITNPGRIVSTGLNAAIRAARGDVILRMDAHTRYAKDYCLRCVEALEWTGADNVGGPARTIAHGALARAIAAAYHSWFSTGGARFHQEEYEGWVDTVPYGCWRKPTLERLGLFDETLVRNQDDELNLRIRRAGGRIWQSRSIRSWYVPRAKLGDLFRQYFQYGFWKVAVIRKHSVPGSWRQVVPAGVLAANALLLLGSVCGSDVCAAIWIAAAAAYAMLNLAASALSASKSGWSILPYLPPIFATYHLSYGAGFLTGLFFARTRPNSSAGSAQIFTRISR